MNKLVKEELEAMKYLLGYQRGKVISEQTQVTSAAPAAAPQTVEEVVKKIQEVLNTKYGAKLTVDGKWGNLTQTAFEAALKTKASAPKTTTAPVASGTTAQTTAAPVASGTTAQTTAAPAPAAAPTSVPTTNTAPVAVPPAEKPEDIVGAPTTPAPGTLNQTSQQALAGQLTPQQIRQQARFDQRLARQARRVQNRAQQ
jgi:hypothetical protein